MSVPRVSVLIPVYNCGARYLREAMDSVLGQTFGDFECIAIDDGSTDSSGEVLERYTAADRRVRVLRQANQGLPKTLRRAWTESRGRFIARMDGDDIAYPKRFERQLEFLEENPDIGACGTYARMIDPEGDPMNWMRPPTDHAAIDAMLLQGRASSLIHPTLMARREAMDTVDGYQTEHELEDLDLFLRLGETRRLGNVPEVLLDYRMHLRSTNHRRRERHVGLIRETVAAARRRRGLPEAPQELPNPPERAASVADVYADWAFQAALGGCAATSRKHRRNLLRTAPLRARTWRRLLQIARLQATSRRDRPEPGAPA